MMGELNGNSEPPPQGGETDKPTHGSFEGPEGSWICFAKNEKGTFTHIDWALDLETSKQSAVNSCLSKNEICSTLLCGQQLPSPQKYHCLVQNFETRKYFESTGRSEAACVKQAFDDCLKNNPTVSQACKVVGGNAEFQ